jgi:hypothetical protein
MRCLRCDETQPGEYLAVLLTLARPGTMLGGCRRLSVGRIDGLCSVSYNHSDTAESCGRQLTPEAPSHFLLALYTTSEHNDLDHFLLSNASNDWCFTSNTGSTRFLIAIHMRTLSPRSSGRRHRYHLVVTLSIAAALSLSSQPLAMALQ